MRKTILLTLLLGLCYIAYGQVSDGAQQREAMRIMQHANRLQRQGESLQALDSAAYALSVYPTSTAAAEFLRKHWNDTMEETMHQLSLLTERDDLFQCRRRETIYRMLVEINQSMRSVPLPLYGPNRRWVWQPDIQYWEGHWDEAQQELERVERLNGNMYYERKL